MREMPTPPLTVWQKVKAVKDLHHEEIRFVNPSDKDFSFRSPEDALDFDESAITEADLETFSVCAECARLEAALASYRDAEPHVESLWPCPTAKLLT